MTVALILNIVLSTAAFAAVVGLLVWSIATSDRSLAGAQIRKPGKLKLSHAPLAHPAGVRASGARNRRRRGRRTRGSRIQAPLPRPRLRRETVLRRNVPSTAASRERRGLALVLGSAGCFGALGVLTQLAYRAGVPVLGLLWGRYLVAAAVLWLLVVALRRPLPSRRGVLVGVALGGGYSVQALLFAASLKHLGAGLADLLYFAYPSLVAVGATAWRRERWSRRRAAALVAASAGIGLALAGGGTVDPLGVALALGAALGYAAYVLASSALLNGIDPLALATLLCSGAAITLGSDALAHGELTPRCRVGRGATRHRRGAGVDRARYQRVPRGRKAAGTFAGEHRLEHRTRADRGLRVHCLRRAFRTRPNARRRPRVRVRPDPRASRLSPYAPPTRRPSRCSRGCPDASGSASSSTP